MGELFCAGIPPNVTVPTDIDTIVQDIADILKRIDSSRVPFKSFQPGVGPYGEPQLMKLVAADCTISWMGRGSYPSRF
jgi:hypothetical protein